MASSEVENTRLRVVGMITPIVVERRRDRSAAVAL
jgi:hypothetical protein